MMEPTMDAIQIVWLVVILASALVGGGILAILGAIWAPFALAAAGDQAQEAGLKPDKFRWQGLLYSIMLFIPYFWLQAHLRGSTPSRGATVSTYVILYAGWGWTILFSWFQALVWLGSEGLVVTTLFLALLASAIAGTSLWWITLLSLGTEPDGKKVIGLLSSRIRPFLFAYCALILNTAIYLILYSKIP